MIRIDLPNGWVWRGLALVKFLVFKKIYWVAWFADLKIFWKFEPHLFFSSHFQILYQFPKQPRTSVSFMIPRVDSISTQLGTKRQRLVYWTTDLNTDKFFVLDGLGYCIIILVFFFKTTVSSLKAMFNSLACQINLIARL